MAEVVKKYCSWQKVPVNGQVVFVCSETLAYRSETAGPCLTQTITMAAKTRTTKTSTSRSSKNRKPPRDSEASDVEETEPQRKSPRKRARKVDDSDEEEFNSDALDDDEDNKPKKKKKSPKKKRKVADDDDEGSDLELEEGQQIVGVVIDAPKTGQGASLSRAPLSAVDASPSVPPGQVSQNTLDFLAQLQNPECNDREWCVRSYGSTPKC